MRRPQLILRAIVLGSLLMVAGCADSSLDATVVFDHEPTMAQPWTASGDLVDAGLLCPAGNRENTGLWYPDGSPADPEEVWNKVLEAEANEGSHWDVARYGWMEYVCDDGSGTFTLEETIDSVGWFNGEVIAGTGAYVGMTGTCVIESIESEDHLELLDMIGTCEFVLAESSE